MEMEKMKEQVQKMIDWINKVLNIGVFNNLEESTTSVSEIKVSNKSTGKVMPEPLVEEEAQYCLDEETFVPNISGKYSEQEVDTIKLFLKNKNFKDISLEEFIGLAFKLNRKVSSVKTKAKKLYDSK